MNSIFSNKSSLFIIMAVCMSISAQSYAGLLPWSITGNGTTSATQLNLDEWALSYDLNPAGYNTQTWTVSAVVDEAGTYNFSWDYSGFHAYFDVTAFLTTSSGITLVNTGPVNCCGSPSNGFSYNGNAAFANAAIGDVISFQMGGSNGDSNNALRGTLNLTQVPEPTTLAVFSLAFIVLLSRKVLLK